MQRDIFLQMCQKVSVLPSGVLGIKQNIPNDLKVIYDGVAYYPVSINIGFDNDGKVINAAIIHSLKANSTISAKLEDICVYKS